MQRAGAHNGSRSAQLLRHCRGQWRSPAATRSWSRPSSFRARSAATLNSIDFDGVWHGEQQLPKRWVGPVDVKSMPGRGRGLVATRDVRAGELVLISSPLVHLATAEQGAIPNVEELLQKLNTSTFDAQQLAWLRALYAGDAYADPAPVPPLHGAESGAGGQQPRALTEEDVEEALRLNLLALNMFGEEAQDMPASLARGVAPTGHLGVWPEFSLLNHSCAPNCVNYTVGEQMVVRATQDVAAGEELSINYLGRASLRPAAERLVDLTDGYGFSCACARCAAELEDQHADLVSAAQGVFGAVMYDLAPSLQAVMSAGAEQAPSPSAAAAVQQQQRAAVASARGKLLPVLESLERQLATEDARAREGGRLAGWLRASVYEAYNLRAQLQELHQQQQQQQQGQQGGGGAEGVAACEADMLRLAEDVAPGSDLHVLLAVRALSRAQAGEGGPESEAAGEAMAAAERAVRLRYGMDLKEETVARLMQAAALTLEHVAV